MSLKHDFRSMIRGLTARSPPPSIADFFLPPFHKGGQPKDAQFMALRLEGGATGISYLLLADEDMDRYTALEPGPFLRKDPTGLALAFGSEDPVQAMISLAAVNAICQNVMRETAFPIESASDPLGLLSVSAGDRVGMVGLFLGLTRTTCFRRETYTSIL